MAVGNKTMFDSKKQDIMAKLMGSGNQKDQAGQPGQGGEQVPPDENPSSGTPESMGGDEQQDSEMAQQGATGGLQIPLDSIGDVKVGEQLKVNVVVKDIDNQNGLATVDLV